MAIRPIDLPSAAGLEYGKGDVRHFSEGDAVSVPGLSNPTRHLAERDNDLRDKINEVIGIVNNTEQFVPLPLVRTSLPPNDEVVAANYRIPVGFEARVLNASVAAVPGSTDIALIVYYNEGFGGSTGTEVVSTASEFTGGVQFYSAGEFIVVLRNMGTTSLDFASSVLLTLRPLGAQGTLLVGSTVEGPQGLPGMTGPAGPPGPPGSGGAGTPGMVWRGVWDGNSISYAPGDVVSIEFGVAPTRFVSSYICVLGHVSNTNTLPTDVPPANRPPDPTSTGNPTTNQWWHAVAIGSAGTEGEKGDDGDPGTNAEVPKYAVFSVDGTISTNADWVSDVYPGYTQYTDVGGVPTLLAANSTYYFSLEEARVTSSSAESGSPRGLAFLNGRYPIIGRGGFRMILPKRVHSAAADYTHTYIKADCVVNGTASIDTTGNPDSAALCTLIPNTTSTDRYDVQIVAPLTAPLSTTPIVLIIHGVQPIFQI